jgi:predicted esterase
MKMTSWMDLETIPIGTSLPDDTQGLLTSTKMIHDIIDSEVAKGIPSKDIVLGGFSQGGAMAMLAGYTYSKPLAGVACLSGWATLRDELQTRVQTCANTQTPLFNGHGTLDNVVLPECGADAVQRHQEAGVNVTSFTYPVQHSAHPDELVHLRSWFTEVLKVS